MTASPRTLAAATTALFALLALCACDESSFFTDADIDLDDTPAELIVEAYVTPGDTAEVYLTRTYPITQDRVPGFVQGATATLTVDGGPPLTLKPETASLSYGGDSVASFRAFVPAEALPAGALVRIAVATENGERASVEGRVPRAARAPAVEGRRRGEYGEVAFTLTLDDEAGPDSYLVQAEQRGTRRSYRYDEAKDSSYTVVAPFVDAVSFRTGEDLDRFYYGRRYYTTDALFDGTRAGSLVTGNLTTGYYYSPDEEQPVDTVYFSVATVNPEGLRYLDAFAVAAAVDGNPFAEPVIIPDEVEGGRGGLVLSGLPQRVTVYVRD